MNRIALSAQLACIWEAAARKPGNVHRFVDFDDLSFLDFLASAAAVAPVFGRATGRPVGDNILEAVRATRQVVCTNTNLGIILLLAPLAAAPEDSNLEPAVERILTDLTVADSRKTYQAIRLASPGGMGRVQNHDIETEPDLPLRPIMSLAAERDMIARQYHNGFQEVFRDGVPALLTGINVFGALEDAVIHCHLSLLAHYPDSLIARKCGLAAAAEASRWAEDILHLEDWNRNTRNQRIGEFDRWLRGGVPRRNPGTTADLVTASLFVALREGKIEIPATLPWSSG